MSSSLSAQESLRERLSRYSTPRSDLSQSNASQAPKSMPPTKPTNTATSSSSGLSRTMLLPRTRPSTEQVRRRRSQDGFSGLGSKMRATSLELPERLQDGDDAGEDVAATNNPNFMYQSVFNMIAAAGSNNNFQTLEEVSSGNEETSDEEGNRRQESGDSTKRKEKNRGNKKEAKDDTDVVKDGGSKKHARSSSRKLLMSSMQKLRLRPIRERNTNPEEDNMSSSQILKPRKSAKESIAPVEEEQPMSNEAPYLSMLLKGEKEMTTHGERQGPSRASSESTSSTRQAVGKARKKDTPTLAQKLMEIFDLSEPEEVIAEYPAWFLQTVLLAGYLYVTQKHICFYAYLPKNAASTAKNGYLGKRGHHNPRYRRYFFELKGNVLRYYEDPSNIYMPNGTIDLRVGISATVESLEKEKSREESAYIKLVTTKREIWFRADSPQGAKDWVKHLQRVIFRSHNDGDSVKILLPINNVIDLEETKFLEVSDTIKLRVVDNEETWAVDEYYFSFFGSGQEAVRVLQIMVEDNVHHEGKAKGSRGGTDDVNSESESSRQSSADSRGRSPATAHANDNRLSMSPLSKPPKVSIRTQSIESGYSDGFAHESESSLAIQSMDEATEASASQILNRSDVFKPTRHMLQDSRTTSEDSSTRFPDRVSQDTAHPSHGKGEDRIRRKRSLSRKRKETVTQNPTRPTLSASSTLDNVVRAGAYPINRATELASLVRDHSRRMSSQLASQSMGYLEKITGLWHAPICHYGPIEGMPPDDDIPAGVTDEANSDFHSERFREHFALPDSEQLVATYFAYFWRVLPLYGKIYISRNYFCFRSLLPGTRTRLVLPIRDIESAAKKKSSYRQGYPGLVVMIRGHEEIFFDFSKKDARDDCTIMTILIIEAYKDLELSGTDKASADTAIAEYHSLQEARADIPADDNPSLPRKLDGTGVDAQPILFDDPKASILNFKPPKPLRITCLTIGSRGDVQPYIALAKRLMAEGHFVRIATHAEFEPWVRKHGIDFAPVSGDPGELMRICIQYGMFTYSFLKEASGKFRGWLDDLLISAWEACQGSDLLIESPSAMAGIHIAEALKIPYFRAFTMPWTRTRAYPHAFAVPSHKQGGQYNYITYVIIDGVFWKGIAGHVNRWRRKTLNLPATSLDKLQPNKVPFLYNFSSSVVAPPLDYSDWIRITGYWFLDEGDVYDPPADLVAFMQKAKDDGKKLVYIGFGSILVEDPAALTQTVVDAVLKADVRCILAKGWSDRVAGAAAADSKVIPSDETAKPEVPLPPEIFAIKSIPHDWLFPRMDAIAHHGGSGTTGASLRAGVPTIAKPFFGDQFFFGARIEDLGVGICLRKLNSTVFGRALWEATHSERMIAKAKALGKQIRAEDGVGNAITAIYRDLEYAKSLIRRNDGEADAPEDIEEHWTFVDADAEPGDAMATSGFLTRGTHPGNPAAGDKNAMAGRP